MKLSEMRECLAREGIRLTRSLGQNFLHDGNQLRRIVEAAQLTRSDRVLEIGAGSGYQAAILSRLVRSVVTVERLKTVAEQARSNLAAVHAENVEIVEGDGTLGYPPLAPYNGVMVTAATPEIPRPLKEQLAEGGRLIAPVGGRDMQELIAIERHGGQYREERHGGVRFVPLIGKFGWEEYQ